MNSFIHICILYLDILAYSVVVYPQHIIYQANNVTMATAHAKVEGEETVIERVSNEMDKHLARLRDISGEITKEFEIILEDVVARRDKLLQEVEEMIIEFENKKETVDDHLKELQHMRVRFEEEKSRFKEDSPAMKKQEEFIISINSEIVKLASFRGSSIEFNCYSDQLIEQVKTLGEIVDKSGISPSVSFLG